MLLLSVNSATVADITDETLNILVALSVNKYTPMIQKIHGIQQTRKYMRRHCSDSFLCLGAVCVSWSTKDVPRNNKVTAYSL